MSETTAPETHQFGAEVGRLLDLVVHSLYSDREIFLRELVANAADATDRRRFMALSDESLALPDSPAIRISLNKLDSTITITDHGTGMTKEELAAHLGTIARSGTAAFTSSLTDAKPEERPSLIGQFGVGFYSAFMVADSVDVISRKIGTEEAWEWNSAGRGVYTLKPATRAQPGTTIVLHIKPDCAEFLEPYRVKSIIRKWADHIAIPVEIEEEDGKFTAATEGTALWRKAKADIAEADYNAFYRHLGHYFDEPYATIHWRAEGTLEFSALLFIPASKPFMAVEETRESKVRLHVKRMFITDEAKLLPSWLSFVVGIVDTEDLPLNVSREILQTTPVLDKIRKALVNRVLSELKSRAKDAEGFKTFQENFGVVMKEGIYEDTGHAADIAGLLRFASTVEAATTLDEYIGRMKEGQADIFYLAGAEGGNLKDSPQLEGFAAKGFEVLLLSDPIDAFWPGRLGSYKDKKLKSVSQTSEIFEAAEAASDIAALCETLAKVLGEKVSGVVASTRLSGSPAMLVAAEAGPDLAMQRLLKRAGRPVYGPAPKLEINPTHKLIQTLALRANLEGDAEMLLDLAKLQEGDLPDNPAAFVRSVAAALAGG